MKAIKYFFFLLLGCVIILPSFAGVRELQKTEEVAREELKKTMKETSAKQEEIRKKEQEIEKNKEMGKEEEQKIAEKELISLDKEMRDLLDAKIKAADRVLDFDYKDETAKKSKKDAEITKKYLESQIKELSAALVSEGTTITPAKEEIINLSLGERLSKNLQVWRDTTLAKVHESLGNYEKAKQLRDNLVTLYAELNKPLKAEQNLLAVDRLTLKLGEIPKRLSENAETLMHYLERLNQIEISKNKRIKLKPENRKAIEAEAQRARDRLLKPEEISQIFETTLALHDALANDVLMRDVEKAKLEPIEKVLATILMMLDASNAKFNPRTNAERVADAKKQDVVVKEVMAPAQIKQSLGEPLSRLAGDNKATTIKTDPFKAQASKEYKDLMKYVGKLEGIDRTLLKPEQQLELAAVVKNVYEKLSEQYGAFLGDIADFNKRFTPEQRDALINTLVAVNGKKELWNNVLEEAIQGEKLFANEKNFLEYQKKYNALGTKNSKARVVSVARLNAAEIALGGYKKNIENLLEVITTQQDAPAKIDSESNKLDQKIEETLSEVAKADPSAQSVETLRRIVTASSDLIGEVTTVLNTANLSPEAETALVKIELKAIIRNDQASSELARDQGSLTTVIENRLIELPQVERANVAELHSMPTPPPPPSVVQILNDANVASKKPANFGKGNSLATDIGNVTLKKVETQPGKQPPVEDFVSSLQQAIKKRREAIVLEGETPEGTSSEDDENGTWD